MSASRREKFKFNAKLHRKSASPGKAEAVLQRPAAPPGWLTTDDHEIALRRWRGRTETLSVTALEPGHPYFGTFRTQSASGGSYAVEIRSLNESVNSCDCIDFQVNGLGTCKHIEGTIAALGRGRSKALRAARAAGNSRVEVFLDRGGTGAPSILWPVEAVDLSGLRNWLGPFLAPDGTCAREPEQIEALIAGWPTAPAAIRDALRVSRHFAPWVDRARRERARVDARGAFEADVAAGRARSISSTIRCCPISGSARCIWRSASARCWPTTWGSARRSRRSPPANCWRAARASSACWSSARPR